MPSNKINDRFTRALECAVTNTDNHPDAVMGALVSIYRLERNLPTARRMVSVNHVPEEGSTVTASDRADDLSKWLVDNHDFTTFGQAHTLLKVGTDGEVVLFADISHTDKVFSITLHGDEGLFAPIVTYVESLNVPIIANEDETIVNTIVPNRDGFVMSLFGSREYGIETGIINRKTAQLAKQSFYPWLTISLEEYFNAFMESEESALVMIGPAGTGKSTFLRSLISHVGGSAMLAYDPEVVGKSSIIKAFYMSDSKILAYEDIDDQLASREDGNKLMSSILNATDGVIKRSGKKVVFSTNLSSTDKIDPALLRVGRCFDILQFPELTVPEAQRVLADMGREPGDLSAKATWSLAEVMRVENGAQQTINRFGRKAGFR